MENKLKYVTLAFFVASLGKGLVQSFQVFDVCVLAILTAFLGFQEYKSTEKRDKEMKDKLTELNNKLVAAETNIVQLHNSLSSIKLVTNKVFNVKS